MKVAIVHPSLIMKGGAANVIVWLAKGLEERGHDVTIFVLDYKKDLWPDEYHDLKVRRIRTTYPCHRIIRAKKLKHLYCSYQLRQQLRGFDLVNAHNPPSHLWTVWAKERSKDFPPIVWYCQEPKRSLYSRAANRRR